MSIEKFTQGEWVTQPKDIVPGDMWEVVTVGFTICENNTEEKVNKYDAHLISAAPDMYRALTIALEVIKRHDEENARKIYKECGFLPLAGYTGEDNLTCPDGVDGIGAVIEKALKKALGVS